MTFISIPNDQIMNALVTCLPNHQFKGFANQKRLCVSTEIGEPVDINGDFVRRALHITNANDGKTAFTLSIGLYRLVCSNGLQMPGTLGADYKIIHRDWPSTLDFVKHLNEIIQQSIDNALDAEPIVQALMDNKVSEGVGIEVIGNLNVSRAVKELSIGKWVLPNSRRPSEQDNNQWTLLNLVNESIRLCHGRTLTSYNQNKTLLQDIQLLTGTELIAA